MNGFHVVKQEQKLPTCSGGKRGHLKHFRQGLSVVEDYLTLIKGQPEGHCKSPVWQYKTLVTMTMVCKCK